jgi:hypothetical protein
MTVSLELAPQPLHCGRDKFVAGPALSSLFDGAAWRRLKADEALFSPENPGMVAIDSSRACLRSL